MFARKAVLSTGLWKIVKYEIVRNIRGRIRVPIHLDEKNSKQSRHAPEFLDDIADKNPGIGNILKMRLEAFGEDLDSNIDEEDLLDTDPSLDDVVPRIRKLSADLHEKETMNTFQAVKKKHFRPDTLPGMLTYAEKQQILHLHKEDPDYWNEYKLAEGFPASPEIIKKVLKSNFKAYTVKQILRHDEAVRKNWKAFENGELKFDDELQKIYSSFSGRSHFVTDEKEIQKFIPPPPDFASQILRKEFSSIITSSKKYQLKRIEEKKKLEVDGEGRLILHASSAAKPRVIEEETESKWNVRHFTLDKFRDKVKKNSNELDEVIVKSEIKSIEQSRSEDAAEEQETLAHRVNEGDIGVVSKDFDPLLIEKLSIDPPMRINIPHEMWEKDKLYRVGDTFYDNDGYFLYRVPGLID